MRVIIIKLIDIVREAGDIILDVYNSPNVTVSEKADKSPLTEADTRANAFIVDKLKRGFTRFAILSEESKDNHQRLDSEYVWIVDPLDGTKEFVSRNGEFTVNIGLVFKGRPILGIVYVPVKDELYFAAESGGAFFVSNGKEERIHCSRLDSIRDMRLIKSRSHASEKLARLIAANPFKSVTESGSSLKMCLVARNEADVYYRFNPTMEWDTCAAQSIVKEAGGLLTDFTGKELVYNKPDPRNAGGFLCSNKIIHDQLLNLARA